MRDHVPANTRLRASAFSIQTFYWLGQERKTSWNRFCGDKVVHVAVPQGYFMGIM